MTILLTGGAGYVGSACLRYLLEHGEDAIAYDDLSLGHAEAVPEGRLIVGDVHDEDRLAQALKDHNAQAVMHFAAATNVGESVEHPERHYRNNIGGAYCVLQAMLKTNVRRLVFSSTCATYGESPEIPMREDTPQDPCSPYARTKLAVEWMIRDMAEAHGLGFTILRYFNAAGAWPDGSQGEDHDPETHLIPIALQVALGLRERLCILGDDYDTPDGTCIRDYVHVMDLGQAHLLALAATEKNTREVYNVGTGRGSSVLEALRACERVVGRKIPSVVGPRRPGDAPALVAAPDKLKRNLGWKPVYTDIESIVESAWRWHSTHPAGYAAAAADGAARA